MISIGKFYEYRGLSTDNPKPTKALNGCKNGDCFIEMDTGKIYFFDAENEEWIEFGGSGSNSNEDPIII